MKRKEGMGQSSKLFIRSSAKECSFAAVFVAAVISAQIIFAAIPGVEVVTLLFVAYSFCLGILRGMICATAFSFLRQIIFGVYPTVLILYLIYYNFLTLIFGLMGKYIRKPLKLLWVIVLIACLCTMLFTMMDNVLTIAWHGYAGRAVKIYWEASLMVMIPQVFCTALSVGFLFYPLFRTFNFIKKMLV